MFKGNNMIDIKYDEKDIKRFWSHVDIKGKDDCKEIFN